MHQKQFTIEERQVIKSDAYFHIRGMNCIFMRLERCLVALEINVGQSRGGLLYDLIAKQIMFTKYQNYKS